MNNYAAITIKINAFISAAIIRKYMNRTMYYLIIIIWILEIPIFGRGSERRALNSIFCMVGFFFFSSKTEEIIVNFRISLSRDEKAVEASKICLKKIYEMLRSLIFRSTSMTMQAAKRMLIKR